MTSTWAQVRSFDRPVQLLLINQFTINVGFYMLMPFLAGYLSGGLGMATWLVGLVLGARNLFQQGMFLIGGSLADRIGYKPLILAGLALRVVGFALLGLVDSLPALLVASACTGLAGACFNPSVRAYLAQEAADRKVEAFATFNVFYQAGILIGPLLGVLLLAVDFRTVALVAAALFLILLVAQAVALPPRRDAAATQERSMLGDWAVVCRNRSFLLFSLAMIGSYVLNFQVYLGLPVQVRQATGSERGVAVLFAVSGLIAVVGQVRLTEWAKRRWQPGQAIGHGLALMGLSFLPLAVASMLPSGTHMGGVVGFCVAMAPVLATAVLLTVATMLVYPFEMATIVDLAGGRLVGTYYGLYNTLAGIGIAVGNVATGAALDVGRAHHVAVLPWLALCATGALCALALHQLRRGGHLDGEAPASGATAADQPVGESVSASPATAAENEQPSSRREARAQGALR